VVTKTESTIDNASSVIRIGSGSKTMKLSNDIYFSYDDVLLKPQLSIVSSRSEVDTRTKIADILPSISIPIISAPMSSVTDGRMARAMWDAGGYGIIHRFLTPEAQVEEYLHNMPSTIEHERDYFYAGAAIGINEGLDRVNRLVDAGVKLLCLDIAHAHSDAVADFITSLGSREYDLMVGNVATGEGARFLVDLGVDAVKVGIGPGAACTTRTVAGVGVPQLSALFEVASEVLGETRIIADGGIKTSGDMVKALAAGASAVMVGRLLAGADEAPAPGEYYGMASKRAMTERGYTGTATAEGIEGKVETVGPVAELLSEYHNGIRSGISYCGGNDLLGLYMNAEFIQVSHNTHIETGTRI
jgi:IMP dehydrogenase